MIVCIGDIVGIVGMGIMGTLFYAWGQTVIYQQTPWRWELPLMDWEAGDGGSHHWFLEIQKFEFDGTHSRQAMSMCFDWAILWTSWRAFRGAWIAERVVRLCIIVQPASTWHFADMLKQEPAKPPLGYILSNQTGQWIHGHFRNRLIGGYWRYLPYIRPM